MSEMTVTVRDQLLKKLEALINITTLPGLYLANYFSSLRNQVDKEIAFKQIKLPIYHEKRVRLEKIWTETIARIDSFEKECVKQKPNLAANRDRVNALEAIILNDKEAVDWNDVKLALETEENSVLRNLFGNKTIVYLKVDFLDETAPQLIDGKLVIVNGEFISLKEIDSRYIFIEENIYL